MSANDATALQPLLPVHPTAFPGRDNWKQFWNLSWTLARHEMKKRYFGSALGHLWSLLRPLMVFAVMYFVFTIVVKAGVGVSHYPIYLLTSIVIWNSFVETTSAGVGCLVAHENLMRKINFPRFVVPFSLALTAGYQFLLNASVVLVFALASGVEPRWSWLGMIPLLAFFWCFTLGVALALASLYVRLRDLQPIWDVGSQLLFWGSPIIYVATFPPTDWHGIPIQQILAASPISATLTQMRYWFIDPSAPTAAHVLGGKLYLLIPIAIVIVCAVAGALIFRRIAPRVAEEL